MYQPGKAYLVCLPFGWVFVGRFVRKADVFNNIFSHRSYVRRAGQTWSSLLASGPNAETVFEIMPSTEGIITNETLWVEEWPHKLPGE